MYLTQINDDITAKDIGLLSVFGVILPSVDQGTDYNSAVNLIIDQRVRVRKYGYAMLAPILLMTFFSLRQWWRLEKSWNRLWTLPLVLLQVFPQYRALRILYLGLRKKASWRAEKDVYDRDLTSLGMYKDGESPACYIYSTSEISVMGRTEISIMECTDRNICTPYFCVKVAETS